MTSRGVKISNLLIFLDSDWHSFCLTLVSRNRTSEDLKMLSIRMVSAVFALAALAAAPSRAAVLFYGGDASQFIPGYYYTAYNELNSYQDWQVFDSFTVPTGHTWTVTGLFEQFALFNPANPPTSVNWQIRSGLNSASQGTLVASGNAAPNLVANGINLNSEFGEDLTLDLSSTPIVLAGGQTYWLNIQPITPDYYHTFVGGSTNHANAVGGPLDLSSYWYLDGTQYPLPWDASQGLTGIDGYVPPPPPSVPEPSVLVVFASSLLLLFGMRRALR